MIIGYGALPVKNVLTKSRRISVALCLASENTKGKMSSAAQSYTVLSTSARTTSNSILTMTVVAQREQAE